MRLRCWVLRILSLPCHCLSQQRCLSIGTWFRFRCFNSLRTLALNDAHSSAGHILFCVFALSVCDTHDWGISGQEPTDAGDLWVHQNMARNKARSPCLVSFFISLTCFFSNNTSLTTNTSLELLIYFQILDSCGFLGNSRECFLLRKLSCKTVFTFSLRIQFMKIR